MFTWWNGRTVNTAFSTWRFGEVVGTDEYGNTYYRTIGGKIDPALGFERRWVIYNGYPEASMVPTGWYGWLHHTSELPADGGELHAEGVAEAASAEHDGDPPRRGDRRDRRCAPTRDRPRPATTRRGRPSDRRWRATPDRLSRLPCLPEPCLLSRSVGADERPDDARHRGRGWHAPRPLVQAARPRLVPVAPQQDRAHRSGPRRRGTGEDGDTPGTGAEHSRAAPQSRHRAARCRAKPFRAGRARFCAP